MIKNGEIIKNFIGHDRLFVSEWPRESDFPSDKLQCRCEYELCWNFETPSTFFSVENFDQYRFLDLNIIQDGAPALTFKIEQEYFENNISDDDDNFNLADGFYSRTIQQDELTLAFDDTDDGYFHHRLIIGWLNL